MAKKDNKRKKETKPKKPKKTRHTVGALWSGWKEKPIDVVAMKKAVSLEYYIGRDGSLQARLNRDSKNGTPHGLLLIPRECVQPLIEFLQEVDKNPLI